ncbi:hypothetical protein [Oceanobacter mangrovi]|uniref:hypothetical protein n=1 Tax=Oceanobacter mangrovi TaxID=2862510 RepID=UPI001C8D9525|nr:hypothetical protein [Oceanobacter mangrovi]
MLILAKILVTFLTVVLLAVVAERLGPKHAGLLAGFPLGTAIALYFFGWQLGPEFAAQSAVYTLSGLGSAVCLAAGYWLVIRRLPQLRYLPLAIVSGLGCFMLSATLLQFLPSHRGLALAVVVATILLFRTLFKQIPEQKVALEQDDRIRSGWFHNRWGKLLFRAVMASLTILMITGLADWLGPTRAGLLAAFPVSFFPLMLILHLSQGAGVLSTSIRHYPDGIGALVVYALGVSYLYPLAGLHWGTLLGLLASVLYLLVYQQVTSRRRA